MQALLPVASLLFSTGLLLLGHGMQLTLLPLRASANGMPEHLIGLSASSYFCGFIVGCLAVPAIIARAGHIRSFAVLTALMICAILLLDMFDNWVSWMFLRFTTGLAVSGLYAVIESWLNSQAPPESRGRILATYTFITLLAMAFGQALINVGPVKTSTPFSLAAVFMALAIIPIGLTRRMAPSTVQSARIRLSLLFQRSRSAFAGTVLSGLVTGSFWSLGALFVSNSGESASQVSLFMIAAIIGGAIFQYPIGWLSDRVDRRRVLLCLCIASAATASGVALTSGHSWFLPAVFAFGATTMPIYSVALATAADVAEEDEFVIIGTSVLLLNALGGAIAPPILGPMMTAYGGSVLFWTLAILSGLFAVIVFSVSRAAREVPVEAQLPFTPAAPDVAPSSFEMDPRNSPQDIGK